MLLLHLNRIRGIQFVALLLACLAVVVAGAQPAYAAGEDAGSLKSPTLLRVAVYGNGVVYGAPGGSCSGLCEKTVEAGSQFTLTFVAGAGQHFGGWGDRCATGEPCGITVDSATEISVFFYPEFHSLRIHNGGGGQVISVHLALACVADCETWLPYGASLTLLPVADAGYRFAGWRGLCAGARDCSFTVAGATEVTAQFVADEPTGVAVPFLYLPLVTQ